jgi:hypothetical protein
MRSVVKRTIAVLIIMSVSITTNILMISADPGNKFKDVKATSWYYSYVAKLADLKITGGYTDGTYKPNNSVTRAEFVTFLCNVKGYKQMQGNPFIDSQKSWASGYITAALANGIIDLPSDQKFNPNFAITRQEVAEMMCRALNVAPDEKIKTPYSDVTTDSGYSTAAFSNYLMRGSTENNKLLFKPKDKLTRAEAATILVNAYDYNVDKLAFLNEKISEEKAKKDEDEKFTAWQESVKGISSVLLNNNNGLSNASLYESNKYLKEESDYLKNWGAKYGMTDTEFANEVVRVGTGIMNLWYNADYTKLDKLEQGFKTLSETNFINNSMKDNLDYVKNNKFVSEGTFKTSTGLIVVSEDGSMVLRGTIKYRYLSPTSANVLNSELVGSTGKPIKLGVWYEQDYQIRFYPENDGLKFTAMHHLSDIRIAK